MMRKTSKTHSLSQKKYSNSNMTDEKLKNQSSTRILHSVNASINFVDKVNHSVKTRNDGNYLKCNSEHKNKELSFKPQIHEIPYHLYPDKWQNLLKSKRDHWEELIQDNRCRNFERTEKKSQQEQSKLKEFSFSPSISRFHVEGELDNKENVHDKLYLQAERLKSERLQMQRLALQKQNEQLQRYKCLNINTDKWKILNKEKYDLSPLYTRLEKVIEDKKKNKKMVAQKDKEEFSFRPEINPHSKQIVMEKNQISNVVDRLIEEYKRKGNKIEMLREKYQLQEKKNLTFKPQINNYLPSNSQKIRQSKELEVQYNFAPTINPLSTLLTQERQFETTDQKLFRMHNAPGMKRANKLMEIEAEAYEECRFNPQINEISRQMNSLSVKHHICPTKQLQTPIHKPKINEISQCMTEAKRAKSLENIRKKIKQKAEIYKKEVQYSEMKECSFKPKIMDNKVERREKNSQKSLQNVAGFKKFYENIEKANEKDKRKKELQQKLFQLEKSYDRRMSKTTKINHKIDPQINPFFTQQN